MVLLWLVPTVVVTSVAMLWVAWAGREGRGEVDREVALRRMGRVLDPAPRRGLARLTRRRPVPSYVVPARRERSTGLAVRPSRPATPGPGTTDTTDPTTTDTTTPAGGHERRAS